MMKLTITTLQQRPESDHNIVAHWLEAEWGPLVPGRSHEEWRACIIPSIGKIWPLTLVAVDDDETLCGVVALREADTAFFDKEAIELASLYVPDAFRGQGIGKLLIQSACDKARELGLQELVLFTHGNGKIYTMTGWSIERQFTYRNRPSLMMHTIITPE